MSQSVDFAKIVRTIGRKIARLEREQICCGEITLQQFETLRLLHEHRGQTTGELADRLGIDLSTASRNLAVLEKCNYIARTRGKADARQITNELTRKGARCVESLSCDERSVYGTVLARIAPVERSRVLAALGVLGDALDEVSTTGDIVCCPAPTITQHKGNTP